MSKGIVHTHAGDDSDGKIWGIEGVNILFLLAGLLISVGAGVMPFVLLTTYVLLLRQGRPKSFDTDLLETLAGGSGWLPPARQPHNPLFSHASTQRLVH